MKDYRYKGHALGGGIAYGYDWVLGKHWNFEFEAGVGYAHAWYDKYDCAKCSERIGSGGKNYWGVTKLAVSLVYLF